MPYEWSPKPPDPGQTCDLSLWPYRSLLRRDFVLFMGATAALTALPLLTLLGTPVLWALLPFFAMMLGGIWFALHVSYRRGETREDLRLTQTTAHLRRQNPDGSTQTWEANRHWVSVHMLPSGGPVDNYITLRGGPREVELGSFLDRAERAALYGELKRALMSR